MFSIVQYTSCEKDQYLENFIHNIKKNEPLDPVNKKSIKSNITFELLALKNLWKNSDIIIKSVSKGGATIIMNRIDYQTTVTQLIANEEFYRRLQEDPYRKLRREYNKLIQGRKMV